MNLWAGRRSEKALRRQWRKYVEGVRSDIALALGKPLFEKPQVGGALRPDSTQKEQATVPVASSTESQFVAKPLLPKAFVRIFISKVGDTMPSKFAKSDGSPGDDVFYVTFTIDGGKLNGQEFDGQYPNNFGKSVDANGVQKWVSPTRELVEAFLARDIEGEYWEPRQTDESQFDIEAEILGPGLLCQGTLIQQASKDGTKTYNKLTNPMPIEEAAPEEAPAPRAPQTTARR